MMVRIRYKTGTVRNVPAYVGKRLVERRIASYEPEAVGASVTGAFAKEFAGELLGRPAVIEPPAPVEPAPLDLDALTRDELYDLAVERGFDPHPQLGATKLRALLK